MDLAAWREANRVRVKNLYTTMRALYDDGWRSAANLAGVGFVRTWPANRRIPPMIGIDHVLVDGRLTATAFSTFEVPGTSPRTPPTAPTPPSRTDRPFRDARARRGPR